MVRMGMIDYGPFWQSFRGTYKWPKKFKPNMEEFPYVKRSSPPSPVLQPWNAMGWWAWPHNIQDELTDLLRRDNFERGVDIQFNEE